MFRVSCAFDCFRFFCFLVHVGVALLLLALALIRHNMRTNRSLSPARQLIVAIELCDTGLLNQTMSHPAFNLGAISTRHEFTKPHQHQHDQGSPLFMSVRAHLTNPDVLLSIASLGIVRKLVLAKADVSDEKMAIFISEKVCVCASLFFGVLRSSQFVCACLSCVRSFLIVLFV